MPTTRGRRGSRPSTSSDGPGFAALVASGFGVAGSSVTTRKHSYFAPVAANGHGAPPAAMRAGSVVEEKPASWVGAEAEPRVGAFGNDFSGRVGHGSEQPIQAIFPGDKLDLPIVVPRNEFLVPFGDAQDFVHGLDPFLGDLLPVEESTESHTQGGPEPLGFAQQGLRGLQVGAVEGEKFAAPLRGYDSRGLQEGNELFPGERFAGRNDVHEIESQAAPDEPAGRIRRERHNLFTLT